MFHDFTLIMKIAAIIMIAVKMEIVMRMVVQANSIYFIYCTIVLTIIYLL